MVTGKFKEVVEAAKLLFEWDGFSTASEKTLDKMKETYHQQKGGRLKDANKAPTWMKREFKKPRDQTSKCRELLLKNLLEKAHKMPYSELPLTVGSFEAVKAAVMLKKVGLWDGDELKVAAGTTVEVKEIMKMNAGCVKLTFFS